MITNKLCCVLLSCCMLLLTSCGGGGITSAGIGGTGITTTGTITGFGSIFVNGVKFETDAADSIIVDDMSFNDQSALGLGMVVTVTGTVNDDGVTGNAETIFYDDDIEGPVIGLSNNGNTLSFTILGQEVTAFRDPGDPQNPANTVFENTDFDTLVDDDYVEISGFIDNSVSPPVIRATRVDKKGDSSTTTSVEIEGPVSTLDDTNKTFFIGSVEVDYSTVSSYVGMIEADLANPDIIVEVEGSYDMTNNQITAVSIEREDGDSGSNPAEGSQVSLEGIVSEYSDVDESFVILGQLVDFSNAVFDPISLENTIDNGDRVEVEGTIENGILVATEVEND